MLRLTFMKYIYICIYIYICHVCIYDLIHIRIMTNQSLQSLAAETMQKGVSDTHLVIPHDDPVDPVPYLRNGLPWKTSSPKHRKVGCRVIWSSSCSLDSCDFLFQGCIFLKEKKIMVFLYAWIVFLSFVLLIYRICIESSYSYISFAVCFCGATSQDHPREPVHFVFGTHTKSRGSHS